MGKRSQSLSPKSDSKKCKTLSGPKYITRRVARLQLLKEQAKMTDENNDEDFKEAENDKNFELDDDKQKVEPKDIEVRKFCSEKQQDRTNKSEQPRKKEDLAAEAKLKSSDNNQNVDERVETLSTEMNMVKQQLQTVINILGANNPKVLKLFPGTNNVTHSAIALSGPPLPPLPKNGLFDAPIKKSQHPNEDKENMVSGGNEVVIKTTMKEILKEINNVVLEPIPKSPGGTPYQRKPINPGNNSLKMLEEKFKNFCDLPEPENSEWA